MTILLLVVGTLAAAVVVLALDGRRAYRRADRYRRLYRNARAELRARVNAEHRTAQRDDLMTLAEVTTPAPSVPIVPDTEPVVTEAQIDDAISKILGGTP